MKSKMLTHQTTRFADELVSRFVISSFVKKNNLGLLYFEEKQNTNYFDQSEPVKPAINLLMYRSFSLGSTQYTTLFLFSQLNNTQLPYTWTNCTMPAKI